MSKGDKRRPTQINEEEFDERWSKAFKKTERKMITIVFGKNHWIDLTNDCFVGDAEELIEYVNSRRLTVINEDTFLYKDRFWYNSKD